jgi:hypothetical protein
MATIAEQLTSLANTKTAIKNAIVAKGVAVADTDPFSAYAGKIGEISGGGTATKFGASVDAFFGDAIDGVLQKPNTPTALNFTGVTEFANSALRYKFRDQESITSIDFGTVKKIGMFALEYAFEANKNLTNINFSSIETIDQSGMKYAFKTCTGLTSVTFSALQTVDQYGLQTAFQDCTNIETVNFSSLHTLAKYALSEAFDRCVKLKSASFPSLVNVDTYSFAEYSFYMPFASCHAMTEIHFRADMQATIETLNGYDSKFGATNATIYFDL